MALFYLSHSAPERVVELMSAAAALRKRIGTPRPPAYQAKLEAAMAPAINSLDETEQEAATARGESTSLEKIIALSHTLSSQ